MAREREEDVMHITAQYVKEVRGGQRPDVSDYLARYPQYAGEIADFVAYYFAFEADLPQETDRIAELPANFRIAIDSAWKHVMQPEASATGTMTSLLVTASKQRLTLARLASKIGLSSDVVWKLEQRQIQAFSIPKEVYGRLAEVLHQSSDVISAYFEPPIGESAHLQQVAESQTPYQVDQRPGVQAQNFREALEESVQLTEEQKQMWREVLSRERL